MAFDLAELTPGLIGIGCVGLCAAIVLLIGAKTGWEPLPVPLEQPPEDEHLALEQRDVEAWLEDVAVDQAINVGEALTNTPATAGREQVVRHLERALVRRPPKA